MRITNTRTGSPVDSKADLSPETRPIIASRTATVIAISAGFYHTCAIRSDGTAACWGLNNVGQTTVPTGTFTSVSAGGFHTCAKKTDGTTACWGDNYFGQSTPPAGG